MQTTIKKLHQHDAGMFCFMQDGFVNIHVSSILIVDDYLPFSILVHIYQLI